MSIFDEVSYQLVIDGRNLDPSDPTKSRYVYNFAGTKKLANTKVALANVSLFYSWFNITTTFNNKTYQLIHPTLAGTTTLTITMPDGYYTVSDLNTYLQSQLIANGLYLVNASGQFVYYAEILENSTRYAIQINTYPVPTALPAGWTNPGGMTFPAVSTTPQFVILSTNNFRTLVGINAGTYPSPASATTYSKISDVTPKTTPVEQVIVRSNLVQNNVSNPNDILYAFNASGVGFGNLITSQPYEFNYLDVNEGYYNGIEINFVDQNYNAISINDSSILVQLSFKTKKENQL